MAIVRATLLENVANGNVENSKQTMESKQPPPKSSSVPPTANLDSPADSQSASASIGQTTEAQTTEGQTTKTQTTEDQTHQRTAGEPNNEDKTTHSEVATQHT